MPTVEHWVALTGKTKGEPKVAGRDFQMAARMALWRALRKAAAMDTKKGPKLAAMTAAMMALHLEDSLVARRDFLSVARLVGVMAVRLGFAGIKWAEMWDHL